MRLLQDEKILQVVTENRCGSNERVRRLFWESRRSLIISSPPPSLDASVQF